jgi:hypothetical protein
MITIPIRTCGDHWINVDEVKTQLENANGAGDIELDLFCEGASLDALGITPVMLNYCEQHNISPDRIVVANWPNSVEAIPFQRKYMPLMSHFFWLSERYWSDIVPSTHQYRFGYFVGRRTPSRATMLYELYHQHHDDFLFSAMRQLPPLPWEADQHGNCIEQLDQWINFNEQEKFTQWWRNCPVSSIDNTFINNQYDPSFNTNQSLVSHYNKFDIELVAETFTLGTVFFPTEKTIRPLVTGKPMIVYGPVDYLSRLKNLGFKTFDSVWDESYDQFQGPERWHKIHSVISTFLSKPQDEQLDIIASIQPIVEHNRRNLIKIIGKYKPL